MRPADIRTLAWAGLILAISTTVCASPALTGTGRAQRHFPSAHTAGARWDAALDDAAAIDVNRADAGELERLPGIGPALAARIVADREARGRYAGPGGLRRVPGLGPKTLERIERYLSFE